MDTGALHVIRVMPNPQEQLCSYRKILWNNCDLIVICPEHINDVALALIWSAFRFCINVEWTLLGDWIFLKSSWITIKHAEMWSKYRSYGLIKLKVHHSNGSPSILRIKCYLKFTQAIVWITDSMPWFPCRQRYLHNMLCYIISVCHNASIRSIHVITYSQEEVGRRKFWRYMNQI